VSIAFTVGVRDVMCVSMTRLIDSDRFRSSTYQTEPGSVDGSPESSDRERAGLCDATFVAMMETADLRNRNDRSGSQ
jgi:hypothetical protein